MGIRNVLGVLAVLLTACGGSDYAKSSYAPSYGGGGGSTPSNYGGATAQAPASMESRSAYTGGGGGGGDVRQQDQALNTTPERPGLGTGWGESRESHVHEVSFDRSGSTPFAVGALHYNDRRGVEALAMRLLAPRGQMLASINHRKTSQNQFRHAVQWAAREAPLDAAVRDLPPPLDFPARGEPHLKAVWVVSRRLRSEA